MSTVNSLKKCGTGEGRGGGKELAIGAGSSCLDQKHLPVASQLAGEGRRGRVLRDLEGVGWEEGGWQFRTVLRWSPAATPPFVTAC